MNKPPAGLKDRPDTSNLAARPKETNASAASDVRPLWIKPSYYVKGNHIPVPEKVNDNRDGFKGKERAMKSTWRDIANHTIGSSI